MPGLPKGAPCLSGAPIPPKKESDMTDQATSRTDDAAVSSSDSNNELSNETSNDSQLVSALARGIRILQCYSMGASELSARELVERTGLPKPTALRLINTLCEFGMLRYSERISKYVLGTEMLSLAAPALGRMTIRQIARPMMQELADYCQGQVTLAVGYRLNLAYAEVAQGAGSAVYRSEIGTRLSLSRTASGRAYLWTVPGAERERYLQETLTRDPAKGELLAQRLTQAQQELREQGCTVSHGDMQREIHSVAIPLASPIDDEYWVFSCSIAVFNISGNQLTDDIAPRLMSLVRRVEAALGSMTGAAHDMETRPWSVSAN
ncbi:transcriptional regulator, IclR family [Paraburkholderia tropica]|uniref:Transcriptional regulator, IclR family n=2 Tax=Burkholderiaceae TaxID=119060 RepID=A0AAQ1JX10_9BURK|nr:transcriptional regulator, IclR family [Paraburkholderia tropica]